LLRFIACEQFVKEQEALHEPEWRGTLRRDSVSLVSTLVLLLAGFATVTTHAESLAFRTDILPILTKAGCNAGACHGAATGQAGFKLSLLGYDPSEDHLRITRERAGRRIDLDAPSESLLLRKAARQLDHEGGRRLPRDSEDYATVLRWIEQDAPLGPSDLRVVSIAVSPADSLLTVPDSTVTLQVLATLSDGSQRDVGRHALFTSNNDAVATVSNRGTVTVRHPGLTSIMVRYGGQVAAARIALPYSQKPVRSRLTGPHFIDVQVGAELARLGLEPSPPADDLTFLRRVTLDLLGRLPTSDEVRAFEGPTTEGRRLQVVDRWLASPEFTDFWSYQFGELLLVGGKGSSSAATRRYHEWIRGQLESNTPVDRIVSELLNALGNIQEDGPANFLTLAGDPRDFSEHVSRMFLGSRLGCARCHAHPSDRWTQEDYHALAAYFARVGRDGDTIRVRAQGEVDHPKTGLPVPPKPLGAPRPHAFIAPDGADPRRAEFAAWLTTPTNPLFARAFVNRIWKHCFGRGLVEPVDDLRPTNPSSHPELLEELARDFAQHGFDLRQLLRTITSSRTYQLAATSIDSNRIDDRLFSHAYPREMPAPVFLDIIAQATGVPHAFEGFPPSTRAIQLPSPQTPSPTLDILGRCARDRACESSGRSGGGLARALHLINGSWVHSKLSGGILDQLLERNTSTPDLIAELYRRTLSRPPSESEISEGSRRIDDSPHRRESAQDLLWALLNCREFAFNH